MLSAPYLVSANAHSLPAQVLGGLEGEDPRIEQGILPGVGGQCESALASGVEETDTSLPAETDRVGHLDIFTMDLSAEHRPFCEGRGVAVEYAHTKATRGEKVLKV